MKLVVKDIIKTDLAVSSESGQEVYKILNENIKNKQRTNVYFSDLSTITTAFFNAAIGDLYANWDSEQLNSYISIKADSLTNLQRNKLQLVMQNAKNKLTDEELDRY